ncbi:hypothetical protein EUGRSUZ_J03200 [Eucalyptus grandis]|uniref:Uncharacterized protein n=2 Tax=Eucalyptus grandis TaxID=71139 RepID=A0A059AJ36_EUCGR|nr:hypothetical protein EUGRSUZ_J03200 [Eucalyptus grandis]
MNILGWTLMAALGMNASIRLVLESTAKFSLIVAVISSFMVGLVLSAILLATQDIYPSLFSSDSSVQALVKELTPVLALCIIINNFQLVLLGVAVGAGWQAAVAYVNIACYYLFGVPLGLIFGFKLNWGVKGIWCGMLIGTVVQTCVLIFMVYTANLCLVMDGQLVKLSINLLNDNIRLKVSNFRVLLICGLKYYLSSFVIRRTYKPSGRGKGCGSNSTAPPCTG